MDVSRLIGPAVECDWFSQLRNLRVLVLDGRDIFSANPYRYLHRIPNLKMLCLLSNGSSIDFPQEFGQPNAFSPLKKHELEDFKGLNHFLFIEDKAMSKLNKLIIKNFN